MRGKAYDVERASWPHCVVVALSLVSMACEPPSTGSAIDGARGNEKDAAGVGAVDLNGGAQSTVGEVDGGGTDSSVEDQGITDKGPSLDRDEDGIPDHEDPEPNRANPLLFRDDFSAVGPDWTFSSVTMSIDPSRGQLAVERIEPFEREGWIGPKPAWGDYFIRSVIRVDRVGASADTRSGHAGLIARVGQVTPSQYVTCGIDLKSGRVVLAEHEGTRRATLGAADSLDEAGAWLSLRFSAVRSAYVCEIGSVRVQGASNVFDFGSIGFRSFDATFAADWIEVYEILP